MVLAAAATTERILSILTRTGAVQEPRFSLTESTGQPQCWETLVGPGRRGFETDSAEPSPCTMTRTHAARCRQLPPRRRRRVKRGAPPTQMDIPGIHRGSKMTLLLHPVPMAGCPGQHHRWPSKSEKNRLLCLLIHTELGIGRLRHPHQPHLIGEAMALTKKNLQFKGPMGDTLAHLHRPRMKKVDPALDLGDTPPIQTESRKKRAQQRKPLAGQAGFATSGILAS